jgi:membrane-associated phospholipid phosphatase
LDLSLFTLINGAHAPWADDIMLLASALGRGGFVWISVALIAAVFPRHRMAAWRVLLSVGLTFLMVDGVLKPNIDRDRPFETLSAARLIDTRPQTASFPSGHAASAVAGALSVGRLLPAARLVWWPLGAAIAVSRIYVGAHWPSDVLAGAIIGWAMGWFVLGGRRSIRPSPVWSGVPAEPAEPGDAGPPSGARLAR